MTFSFKHFFRKRFLVVSTVLVVVVVTMQWIGFQDSSSKYEDIPLPFGEVKSALLGTVTSFGKRNGIDISEVTFRTDENQQYLGQNTMYLIRVPDDEAVNNVVLDDAMISTVSGTRSVDYYGYRYSDANASWEKRDAFAFRFKDRFSWQFFASKKARAMDPLHQNAIKYFESDNDIVFLPTHAASGSSVRLGKNSLFLLIVNETGGAILTIRGAATIPIPFSGSSRSSSAISSSASSVSFSASSAVSTSAATSDSSSMSSTQSSAVSSASSISSLSNSSASPATSSSVQSSAASSSNNCGNGIVDTPEEECDDGNAINADSCSNSCMLDVPVPSMPY